MATRRVIQTGTDLRSGQFGHARTVDVAASRSIDRNRRTVRSPELLEAVRHLDATTDPASTQAIMQWINDEYEARQGGTLFGLFGKCNLGGDYVDHRIDLTGGYILEHFTRADMPPAPFSAARPLARSDAYLFIEVYTDGTIVPVRSNGRPVV